MHTLLNGTVYIACTALQSSRLFQTRRELQFITVHFTLAITALIRGASLDTSTGG